MQIDQLLKPEIEELIQKKDLIGIREAISEWEPSEIATLIRELPSVESILVFRVLPRDIASTTFEYLGGDRQEELIESLARDKTRLTELLNDLSPDDRTSLLEELPAEVAQRLIALLSPDERKITTMLLGYPEESIGRLMTTDYVAVRPHWTIKQVLEHIRRHGKDSETLNVIYIVDKDWRLVDDLRIRELLLADPDSPITDLMDEKFISLKAYDDQEKAVQMFRDYDRIALPVTDSRDILLGIVTVDDVLDVAEEETTEDIQKIGGSEALDEPYLTISLRRLVQKRARWLVFIFLGEMFTASAMGYFETELHKATMLVTFIPLILSTGGNSGSQAATLIIRAMSVGEFGLRDWFKVMKREILSGLALGLIFGILGILRVTIWQQLFGMYGVHWMLVMITIGCSLVGVVLWGTLIGSMMPFIMRSLGADPAVSSSPFVATLVDVTGLVIYFSVAALLLTGTLL